jgi:hypothetical protein
MTLQSVAKPSQVLFFFPFRRYVCSAEAAVDGTDEKNEETEGTLLKQEKQCC